MSTRAKVTSVEAIESFRTQLILYMSKARPTAEEVNADVMRTRTWLESDRKTFWEAQVRRRAKILEQAKQELFSAELSNLRDASAAERLAVNRAKRALDEAEDKLRMVRKWTREFNNRVEPVAKQLERLHTVLANTAPEAIAHLAKVIKVLPEYAEIRTETSAEAPAPVPSGEAAASGEKPAEENPQASTKGAA